MDLKPMVCPNCGGAVNMSRLICEFCGTRFKDVDSNSDVIKIETFTSPTRIMNVESRIPNEFVALCPEHVLDKAKDEIAQRLARNLLQGGLVEFSSGMDFARCEQIISARLRVLDPRYKF